MANHRKSRESQIQKDTVHPVAKIRRALELPEDTGKNVFSLETIGNKEAIVEGCKGILEYDENLIKLNCRGKIVQFNGTGLSMRSLTLDTAVVLGNITSIEFIS